MAGNPDVPFHNSRRFHFTGSLLETSFYVERPADRALPEALLEGHYCHILAPRQIGKSSLRARTARELHRRGARCASIDLTSVGTASTIEEWYFGLVEEIAQKLRLEDPVDFWERRRNVAPDRRLSEYLRWVLKSAIPEGPVIVFLDEIEAVRLVSFDIDQFFLVLRSLHDDRANEPDLARLCFCLIGVTTPNDLIENKQVTPFNVSLPIRLDDFTRKEMDGLARGLEHTGADMTRLLDATFAWTGGHPYMTMRVCATLAQRERIAPGEEADAVDAVVLAQLLERPLEDPNLNYAARRFDDPTYERGGVRLADKILLYRRLLEGKRIPANNEDAVQMELRLCGMVKYVDEDKGRFLCLRNAIYSTALDAVWLRTKGDRRFIAESVWKWLDTGKNPGALLRGVVLEHALLWAKTNPLSDDEQAFLDASQRREAEDLEHRRIQAQADLEKLQAEKDSIEREKEHAEDRLTKTQAAQQRWNSALIALIIMAFISLGLAGVGLSTAKSSLDSVDRANDELLARQKEERRRHDDEVRKLKEDYDHQLTVVSNLQKQVDDIQLRLTSAKDTVARQQSDLKQTQTKLEAREDELKATKRRLEAALEETKQKLDSTVAELAVANQELKEKQKQLAEVVRRLTFPASAPLLPGELPSISPTKSPFDDPHILNSATPRHQ
jgi:hypothetical protein